MTRFVVDAAALVRLATDGLTAGPAHQLVAPAVIRSESLALLFAAVRRGELTERDARGLHTRMTETKIRTLGDRVSRWTAWTVAREQGWDDLRDAEYVAVTMLQADALIALDDGLGRRAAGLVPLGTLADLVAELPGAVVTPARPRQEP